MGRSYAGIMGSLAFFASLVRGWIGGLDAVVAVNRAWFHLLAFAAIGLVIGRIAGWIVDESVRSRFATELQAKTAPHESASAA